MRYEFLLPDIGEGLTEAIIQNWLIEVGADVQEDAPLCELETDKAIVEIPAPCTGKVLELHGTPGQTLAVGSVLAVFETEAVPQATGHAPQPSAQGGGSTAVGAGHAPEQAARDVLAAPSTRKFARESGVDLGLVSGSGPHGRVLRADVQNVLAPAADKAVVVGRSVESARIAVESGQQRIPIKGLRRAIAEAMVRSATIIPHATSMFRCNGEQFLVLRKALQERLGVRVSFTAMVMKAMVPALQKYPYFNCSIDDSTQEIVLPGRINIGFATHTDEGVIVPVVKDVDRLSLAQVSAEIDRLAVAARERKISLEDMRGGTITLSNVGSHGTAEVTGGQPIINHPQSAIVVMQRIGPQAVVRNGQVVAQQCMNIGTSYDHRIIDGIYAGLFMEMLTNVIEEPGLLLGL